MLPSLLGFEVIVLYHTKGAAECAAEALVRLSPGTHVGNPMSSRLINSFESPTGKNAHLIGKRSVISAAVTPTIVLQLSDPLIVVHLPGASGDEAHAYRAVISPLSLVDSSSEIKTEYMVYIFYAFAWINLARPFT